MPLQVNIGEGNSKVQHDAVECGLFRQVISHVKPLLATALLFLAVPDSVVVISYKPQKTRHP
jgi:hypothetical protein